jgi:hypothetical protein
VGIDLAYGDSVAEAKRRIDEVSSYTNLFVIGTTGITNNATKLDECCQYAYDKGLSFIVYSSRVPRKEWLEEAKERWGGRFLGFHAYDEIGGMQLDYVKTGVTVFDAQSYAEAATQFVDKTTQVLNRYRLNFTSSTSVPLFTSDYALFWFTYKAGYDVILAQFGWNHSRQLDVALCRGAATAQNKEWGAVVTWTYTNPPYIASGEELYKDLVLAYDNGAKYIAIFDSNKAYTQGILKEEHLQALRRFWQYAQTNPRRSSPVSNRVSFVLPKDYGYGFRGTNDKLWGLWDADALSYNISTSVSRLLDEYGDKLDIIYDDGLLPGNTYGYSKLIYWDDPSLSQPPSQTPQPSNSPASLPPSTQASTSTTIESPPSLTDYVLAIAAVAVVGAVSVPVVMLRKRQYSITINVTGIGMDFPGTVVVVDGESYDRNGASFWWDRGSSHTFEFKSPIVVNRGKQHVKQYVWDSTTGLATKRIGTLTVSTPTSVTGNYRPVFKMGSSLPTVMNNRLRFAKGF